MTHGKFNCDGWINRRLPIAARDPEQAGDRSVNDAESGAWQGGSMSDKPIMGVVVPAIGSGPAQPVAFTVKDDKPTRVQKMVREQIADAVEADINGEVIMKEVWEQLRGAAVKEAEKEMRSIVAWLRRASK